MPENVRLADVQAAQKLMRVGRELMKAELVGLGLRRFSEADLIRDNHAIAVIAERSRSFLPISAAEIFSVQQHNGLCGGFVSPFRCDIHVGHFERLSLSGHPENLDREWIGEFLESQIVGRERATTTSED